jgi:hypothetical protein
MDGARHSELRVNVAGNPELDVQVTRTWAWRGAEIPAVGGKRPRIAAGRDGLRLASSPRFERQRRQVESVSMVGRPDPASDRSPETDGLWTLLQIDQQRITALDTVAVAIRGWVVTLDSALASFAFTKADPIVIAVAIGATLLFLPLDLRYRRVQLLHADRSNRIEQQVAADYRFRAVSSQSRFRVGMALRGYGTMAAFYAAILLLLILAVVVV